MRNKIPSNTDTFYAAHLSIFQSQSIQKSLLNVNSNPRASSDIRLNALRNVCAYICMYNICICVCICLFMYECIRMYEYL